jgi:hypothetical protein
VRQFYPARIADKALVVISALRINDKDGLHPAEVDGMAIQKELRIV